MKRSNHFGSKYTKKKLSQNGNQVDSLAIPYSYHFLNQDNLANQFSPVLVSKKTKDETISSPVSISSTTSFGSFGSFSESYSINPIVSYKDKDDSTLIPPSSKLVEMEVVSNTAPIIEVKDSVLHQGDEWKPSSSFVSAKDENGNPLRLNQLKVEGVVNQTIPGKYHVRYIYKDCCKDVTVMVKRPTNEIRIEVRNLTLSVGEIWNPKDSFVQATDQYEEEIPFEKMSVSDSVDTSIPGITMLFFSFQSKTVPVYITVEHALPTINEQTAIVNFIIQLVNSLRDKLNLARVEVSPELTKVATIRATELSTLYAHTRPNGDNCFLLYEENHYIYEEAGENIAYIKSRGSAKETAKHLFLLWKNSPGHYANLVNPTFSDIGVSIYADESTGSVLYACQNFGSKKRSLSD